MAETKNNSALLKSKFKSHKTRIILILTAAVILGVIYWLLDSVVSAESMGYLQEIVQIYNDKLAAQPFGNDHTTAGHGVVHGFLLPLNLVASVWEPQKYAIWQDENQGVSYGIGFVIGVFGLIWLIRYFKS